jgi:hypothetical protein
MYHQCNRLAIGLIFASRNDSASRYENRVVQRMGEEMADCNRSLTKLSWSLDDFDAEVGLFDRSSADFYFMLLGLSI